MDEIVDLVEDLVEDAEYILFMGRRHRRPRPNHHHRPHCRHRHHARILALFVNFGGQHFVVSGGTPLMASIDIKDTQDLDLAMQALDAEGNSDTAAVESWTSSDANIISIEDNGDGTAKGVTHALGSVDIVADAKDPDGNDVSAVLTVNVGAGDAASVAITATPVDKGAPSAKAKK